jgi:acetyl-CoA carboxylase carboxyl transferase subunit beta
VISPEGCAAILWNDPSMADRAAAALRIDAKSLLRQGIVDGVVVEPEGGSQADPVSAGHRVRAALTTAVHRLSTMDGAALRARRYARFRSFGTAEVTGIQPDREEQP